MEDTYFDLGGFVTQVLGGRRVTCSIPLRNEQVKIEAQHFQCGYLHDRFGMASCRDPREYWPGIASMTATQRSSAFFLGPENEVQRVLALATRNAGRLRQSPLLAGDAIDIAFHIGHNSVRIGSLPATEDSKISRRLTGDEFP